MRAPIPGNRPRRFVRALAFTLAAIIGTAISSPPTYANITYVHDADGRLIAVIDGSGNAVTYTYDADGNILTINTSNSSSGEAVYVVSPDNGPVNTAVTIYGHNFPASPSVTFYNGKTATVSSSTSTTINTTVPTGATSGPVRVDSIQGPYFTVN